MEGKKERSRIRAVQMDNLRGFLDIRRMDKVPNAQIRVVWSDGKIQRCSLMVQPCAEDGE